MLPSPSEILGFLEIAATLNITKAAQRLGVSQPTLSQALKKLESTVGERLVSRSKNGVELTVAGKQFYKQAQQLLDYWERVKAETKRSVAEVKGNVRLGCHPSVGLYSLDLILPKLISQYPLLEFTLVHDLSRKITEKVINYEVDLGLVINPIAHPDLVMTKLFSDEIRLWKSHNKVPKVLLCHPELLQTQDILKRLKRSKKHFDRVITSNNLEIICRLTIAGCGYGILPERVVSIFNVRKSISPVTDSPTFFDELFLIYRTENKNIQYVKTVKDVVIQALNKS